MKKLILYLLEKYHGNWDMIYDSISNKEPIDWNIVNKVNDKFDFEYMPIVSDNYPNKLKTIYMPPFSLFYDNSLEWLNKNVLTIYGSPDIVETKELINIAKDNVILCISYEHLSEHFYNDVIKNRIKLIVVIDHIDNFKYLKNDNILLISEYNNSNFDKSIDQTIERLLYAFADKLLVLNNCKINNLKRLIYNFENIEKEIYYSRNAIDKDNEEIFNNVSAKLANEISQINFLIKN